MSISYAISQEVNPQVIIWTLASAVYRTVCAVARLAAWVAACIPALLAVLQVAGMTLACTALIVGAVVGAAMYPAIVICGFVLVCVAFVSMPR